ncbi:MAG: 50S ribosomal protein L23 [Candidatus Peribacteria bacterium]|jgi:large subunit ribosomal protein L23|nr:50S ribosomal protein L23 [Candidatus Peribacteria bacterium]
MRIYRILKKPIVTEKTSAISLVKNVYVFEVSEDATKIDIKKAISEIY